jgi:hypothetical protein
MLSAPLSRTPLRLGGRVVAEMVALPCSTTAS